MDRHQTDCITPYFTASAGDPLIGVLTEEDGRLVVRYSAGDEDGDAAPGAGEKLRAALSVIGAWSDLDWEEFADELDRIRHESRPTPPIDL